MESSVQHRIDADDTARESALHRHVHFGNSLQTSLVEQQCTTSGRGHLCGHRRKCASEILSSDWMPTSPQNNFGLPKGVLNFGFRIVNFGLQPATPYCRKFGIMSAYKYPLDVFNLSVTGWISGFLDWNTSGNSDKVSCLLDHY